MNITLSHIDNNLQGSLQITGSKSESNRMLILQGLYPNIKLQNLSNSDDTRVMQQALTQANRTVDIHHAGTAMRFLTAYFAALPGSKVTLTGSDRMKERPIELLVDALREIGAEISYAGNSGVPPLEITGKTLQGDKVKVAANISSQYISALMLIAASLPQGLKIELQGKVTSVPYIFMTLQLLEQLGIKGEFSNNQINIEPQKTIEDKVVEIESDWSSASYFYSMAAIAGTAKISLSNYKKTSLQGDSCIAGIYELLGIITRYTENIIHLEKQDLPLPKLIEEDLQNAPDIAQTIAVTCLALGIECKLRGLHTLKIKETDRLVALKTEMEKFGARVEITGDSLHLFPLGALKENVHVATYNDHRMAMAFAPLALKVPVIIEDAGVVSKSYPTYWDDMETLGFTAVKARKQGD